MNRTSTDQAASRGVLVFVGTAYELSIALSFVVGLTSGNQSPFVLRSGVTAMFMPTVAVAILTITAMRLILLLSKGRKLSRFFRSTMDSCARRSASWRCSGESITSGAAERNHLGRIKFAQPEPYGQHTTECKVGLRHELIPFRSGPRVREHDACREEACLARHPRYHVHFTPMGGSWFNLVERLFAEVTERCVRRGSYTAIRALERAMLDYLDQRNRDPKPASKGRPLYVSRTAAVPAGTV